MIDQIKERLDIVDYISQVVSLKKSGSSYVGLCPFHNEHTPSFHVFPETQRYKCFGGCGEGGDLFDFYMKKNNVDMGEAIRALAERAGVEIPKPQEQHDHLREALTQAIAFFHECLRRKEGKGAFEYLQGRGIEIETIKVWQLGYAPDAWRRLYEHMSGQGWSDADLIRAGLCGRSQKSDLLYDRFRGRVMIPILDAEGRPAGLGGRALGAETTAKYLNTPQTPLFDKSGLVFGLHRAKSAIREHGAVLVEGYMDVIVAHQAGFTNVVGQMGTAFTEHQGRLLTHYNQKLTIALDGDTAGMKASERDLSIAADLALADRLTLDIRLAILPAGYDPDSLIRADADQWRSLVTNAQGAAEVVIARAKASLPDQASLHDKERVARQALPILMATERDLSRATYIQMLALGLGLPERELADWAAQQRTAKAQPEVAFPSPPSANPAPLERLFMVMLLRKPMELAQINKLFREHELDLVGPDDFAQPAYRTMFDLLQKAMHQDDEDYTQFAQNRLPAEFRGEFQAMQTASGDPVHLKHCAMNLRRNALQRRNKELVAVEGRFDELQANMRGIFVLSGLLRSRQVC